MPLDWKRVDPWEAASWHRCVDEDEEVTALPRVWARPNFDCDPGGIIFVNRTRCVLSSVLLHARVLKR